MRLLAVILFIGLCFAPVAFSAPDEPSSAPVPDEEPADDATIIANLELIELLVLLESLDLETEPELRP